MIPKVKGFDGNYKFFESQKENPKIDNCRFWDFSFME